MNRPGNEQRKTVPNSKQTSYESTSVRMDIINVRRQVEGNCGHMVQMEDSSLP